MRSPAFSLATWVASCLVLLAVTLTSFTVSAQSMNCHNAIMTSILKVKECAAMTPAQLAKLDAIIHGMDDTYKTFKEQDPAAMACLTAIMWDIVHYKAELWKGSFNPVTACTWTEMMQYFAMIPKVAAVFGTPTPAPYVLVDAPK